MKNQVIYLIEVYNYTENEEPRHYSLSAWTNREDAIKQATALMEVYKIDGYKIYKSKNTTCGHIGWISNGENSRHYWINEIALIR